MVRSAASTKIKIAIQRSGGLPLFFLFRGMEDAVGDFVSFFLPLLHMGVVTGCLSLLRMFHTYSW